MKKKSHKKKHTLTTRLNLLFFIVFILFTALIFRLGVVQIVEGEEFENQLEHSNHSTIKIDAPRGLMYDRNGKVIVNNELVLSLTYKNPSRTTSSKDMIQIAYDLAELIDIETEDLTDRDKHDFVLQSMTEEERYELVSREERNELETISEEYKLEIERLPEKAIRSLSEKELKAVAIFTEMAKGSAHAPQRIKRNITEDEAHTISELLFRLPGVSILRDSRRSYPYGESFKSLFGSTGSISREELDYYVSRGYARSDIVGTSFLELQYEEVLRGQKTTINHTTSTSGGDVDQVVTKKEGRRGNDLVLALDMELQQAVEKAIDKEIKEAGNSFVKHRSAYAVFMNPKTGDILSMAGFLDPADVEYSTTSNHIGNVNKAFEMGSSVKAASVLTGFQSGVTTPGTEFFDRPLSLPGAPTMSSYKNFGWVDDRRALEVSSNVYMFEIGLRMAGCFDPKSCDFPKLQEAYEQVRYYFSQFGLGSKTGVDLPSTTTGITGGSTIPGKLAYLMIGQFDTYTPLQLAQYISTIANDGFRMKPRLVTEIREPTPDIHKHKVVTRQFKPKVLNRIDMKAEYIDRVKQGLRDVVTKGTASSRFANAPYELAAKTGTAQVRVKIGKGKNGRIIPANTQTFVGFAPYNDPEIAFAIVVPDVKLETDGGTQGIAQDIAKDVLDTYFQEEVTGS